MKSKKSQNIPNSNMIQVQGGNNLIGDLLLMGATSSSHSAGRNNAKSAINSEMKQKGNTVRQNGRESSRAKNQGFKSSQSSQ